MAKTITFFTIFTIFTFFLFAISTASIASDPVALPDSDVVYKSSFVPATVTDSDVDLPVLPTETSVPLPDVTAGSDRLPESENTQTFDLPIEPTLPVVFSQRHPIQRYSFDRSTRIPLRFVRRHPCRKFKKMFITPTKMSYGNDMISTDKTTKIDLEAIGDNVPTKWLEFKHKYGHRHHHYHHDKDEKFEFDEEKLNSMPRHHKEKKREHKGGFMRRIRKFLKHTFD